MSRVASVKKRAEWAARLRRFASGGLSVAKFCAAENVSTASFYQWRVKLAAPNLLAPNPQPQRSASTPPPQPASNARPQPRSITPPKPNAQRPSSAPPQPAAFVPVHVAAISEVAIHLPSGVRVTLPAHERELIERAISVLVQAATPQERR